MKVYVDELPKSCERCPLRYYECDSYWCAGYEGSNVLFADEVKELNLCPLQSLAEHDKQVRKEVISKVYEVLEQAIPRDLCWSWAVIKKELDQIQGEPNET